MKRGFTLLEVMLAIAVLAIVGTMVYGGFAQTSLNKTRIESDLDYYQTTHMALERIVREITMAFTSTHVNPSLDLRTVNSSFVGSTVGKKTVWTSPRSRIEGSTGTRANPTRTRSAISSQKTQMSPGNAYLRAVSKTGSTKIRVVAASRRSS